MPFFFILAALPAAGAVQFAMSVAAWRAEKHVQDARTARLMAELRMGGAAPGAEQRLGAEVRRLFNDKGTSRFRHVALGGVDCQATDEQIDLLNEALEGADDNKVRALLALILTQSTPLR